MTWWISCAIPLRSLSFDATKVEANASLDSMGTRLVVENRLEEHLAGIFPEEVWLIERTNTEITVVVGATGQEGQALAVANARQDRWIEQAGRQERDVIR